MNSIRWMIAAFAILAALTVQQSKAADLILTGNWSGLESVTTFTSTGVAFPTITYETYEAQFSFTYDTVTSAFNFSYDGDTSGFDTTDPQNYMFLPQSISGSLPGDYEYYGVNNFNFSVSYPSVPLDGVLDDTNSFAGFNATIYSDVDPGLGSFIQTTYSFNSAIGVPEPSSLALAAAGTVALVAYGLYARYLRRGDRERAART